MHFQLLLHPEGARLVSVGQRMKTKVVGGDDGKKTERNEPGKGRESN